MYRKHGKRQKEKTKGKDSIVALLDTGVETTHDDLKDSLLDGWDFVNDDDSVNDVGYKYEQWHGTHIAGIIAAKSGNGIGIAGVAPEAKILPLKIFQGGRAYTSDVIEAIHYAEMCGAKIANCSWGTLYDNPALKEAIENSNMVFVCAAGNNLYDTDQYPVYPASYDLDNVISVTSIDPDGRLSRFANYGKQSVDIAAPGRDIYSTTIDNGFVQNSGTSMSAGYVSGALALLLSKEPAKTAEGLKSRIVSSGDVVTGLKDKVKNGKKLNCGYALSINPLPNFNSIVVDDSEPISEVTPNGEMQETSDEFNTFAENSISTKTPMLTPRYGLGVVAVGNKIYAIGGRSVDGYSNKVEEYDPATDTWKTKANMPTACCYFGIEKIDEQIYVLGGYNDNYLNIVQAYNPATDTWTTMPSNHNMPVAMRSFAATAYKEKIYVTGGYNGSYRNTIYEYTPSAGAWVQKHSLSYNRGEHVAVEYNGKIYIDGGCTTNGNYFNAEEVYNPATNQVEQSGSSRIRTVNGAAVNLLDRYVLMGGRNLSNNTYSNQNIQRSLGGTNSSLRIGCSMYYSRAGLGAAEVNGRVYIMGGYNSEGIIPTLEELDLGWEIKGDLPIQMRGFTCVECTGKLYLMGGDIPVGDKNETKIKSVYEYNPQSNTWIQKMDMPDYRENFAIAVVFGKIYVIGGKSSTTASGTLTADNKVYEFDPQKDQWAEKSGISSPRDSISAAVCSNTIYIAGGCDRSNNDVAIVQKFDPLKNKWETKGNLPNASVAHYLTTLNSKIFCIGGIPDVVLTYDEDQDLWQQRYGSIDFYYDSAFNSLATIYDKVYSFISMGFINNYKPSIKVYDPVTNSVGQYFTFPMIAKTSNIATLNNKVYFFGRTSDYASKLIEYRPKVSPWLEQGPWSEQGSNIAPSYHMGICTIGNDIYHVGGYNGSDFIATNGVNKLNTQSNYWSAIPSMKYARAGLAVGTLNGKIYAAGGRNSKTETSVVSYVEEYDPSTNKWVNKAAIPTALRDMASTVYNGKLYLFGGTNGSSVYNTTYIYDSQVNKWSTGATMPTARYGCGASLLSDGKIYIVGGINSSNTVQKKVEVYDPLTNTWTTKKDMPAALSYAGVTGIDSLYVIGGKDSSSANGLVYEYSPVTDKWFSWQGPGLALYGLGAVIVNNGVYAINGMDMENSAYNLVKYLPLGSYNSDYIHLGDESINLSGNLARNYTDMSYSSLGFQINFSRTYNSRDDKMDGNIISKGWTFGFQGKISSAGNDTLARLPNGSGYLFRENMDGTFEAKDSRSTLIKQSDGGHILTTKDLYSYGFNSAGYLIWMKDRNGNTINITVDSADKITQITDPVGRQTRISYSNNKIYKIIDFAGRVVEYSYNGNGQLSTVTDPMGNMTRYSYDSKGFLSGVKDHNNNLIESYTYYDIPSYETLPKMKTITDALGKAENYRYDEGEGMVTVTDNNSRQNITWYDNMLYPIKQKDAEGKEQRIEYNLVGGINKYGEEKVVVDRRGNATYYDRDSKGNVIRQINPNGSIKEFTYDDKNNMISERDELGNVTFYYYDSNKINLLYKRQKESIHTRYNYYSDTETQEMCGKVIKGLLKSVKDPRGFVTTYTYDSYGNIATTKNALNQTEIYQYNPLGWLKQETSVKGYITKYYYDRNGNIIKKVSHGGETERAIYDYKGNITQNIMPNQYLETNDTASTYDGNNILTNTNSYGEAEEGYRYVYYLNGLLKKEIDSLNNETNYTYDQYGNVLTKRFTNGYAKIYTYDVLDRVKSTAYQNSSSAAIIITDEYSYDITSDGHLEKTNKHYFNSSYAPEAAISKETYDYADRLIRTDNADGGYSTNEYEANGNLSITTDPMGNKVYYVYDRVNRETGKWSSVSDGVCSYERTEYDRNGNVKKQIQSRRKVTSYAVPTYGIVLYNTFTYDEVGRVIEEKDSQGGRITYTYDDTTDKVTKRQYTNASEYVETESLYNHLGSVKENALKVNSTDMKNNKLVLKTTYTFDKEGNILTETNPNNVVTTHTYDLFGREISVTEAGIDENGEAATLTNYYTYDFRGNVLTKKDSLNRTTTYTYTPAGLLSKEINPKDGVIYTKRMPDGLVVAEISPKNYTNDADLSQMTRTTYHYDVMGRVVKEKSIYKDTSGTFKTITKEYTYDKNGNLLTSKDGMGYVTKYTYDGQDRQLTVLDPEAKDKGLSFTTKYTYDGVGQNIAEENGVHAVTSYTYNDQGKVLTVAVDGETIKTCTYDNAGNMLSESDGNGNTTTYKYNALGKVRTKTLSGDDSIPSHTVSYRYTDTGDVAKVVDSLGKTKEYIYDNQNNLLSEKEIKNDGSAAISKGYRYDLMGDLRFFVDGNGNTTEFTYDELDQKISQKIAVTVEDAVTTQTTTFAYDADGRQTEITDWLGNKYVNVYDSLGRLVIKKDPLGNVIEKLAYDNNHRQIGGTDALNNVVTFAYDKAGRLISKTDASNNTESKAYDAAGNLITSTDGNGNVTTYQYDANKRLKAVTNPLEQTTSYTYDAVGNLLSQTDGNGNITTYQYNARNLPTMRIDAGGVTSEGAINATKTEKYQYTSDGKLATKIDRNGVVSINVYDIHGRLLSEDVGGSIVSYTYDNNNNQLTMTDGTGTTTRVYDELGRVISKTVPKIGTTTYSYDQISGLDSGYVNESYQDPKGNAVVKTKDKVGRLYQVKDGSNTTTYTYYDDGNLQKLEYPNGAIEEYTYYANDKLHTLKNKQGSNTLEAFCYEYDGAGNMTGKVDRKGTTSYTYDDLNRMLTVTEPTGKVTAYEFDGAGNRKSETITEDSNVTKTDYTYNEQNRLIGTNMLENSEETGGVDYSFDNNGNVLSERPYTLTSSPTTSSAVTVGLSVLGNEEEQNGIGATIYEYDNRNQMIKTVKGAYTVESEYNGNGLRVSKTVNGDTSNYLYEYDKIILETNGKNAEVAQNIYGTNLINRSVGSDKLYYMYNGHGDATSLQTEGGTSAAQYYYDAFGTATEAKGDANNPFRYAGYEYDDETDLYYLKSRMYNSVTARFMQEDTYRGQANDPLSLNLYAYCVNNPLIYYDPDGHSIKSWVKKLTKKIKNIKKSKKPKKHTRKHTKKNKIKVVDVMRNVIAVLIQPARNNTNDVKPTNNISVDKVKYPDGSLRAFIQNGHGNMRQDALDKSLYHATVGGVTVNYVFKDGILYDKKTNGIVGAPVDGHVRVSGTYYNNTFAGGQNQSFGGSRNEVRNIEGEDHIITVQYRQETYANGNKVHYSNEEHSTGPEKSTNKISETSTADIQEAFQNSIRGGNFDNSKNGLQCVDLTKWFIDTYTTLAWSRGNGKEQAANVAAKNNLPTPSSTPKAWSVFSVRGGYKGWGSRGTKWGHTGIVLSVDEVNKTCTVIQTGSTREGKTPNSWIKMYSYPKDAVTFTYLGDYMK